MEQETKIRKHIYFYGRVQGVGFRYTAKYLALSLGLTGWARNEYDGSVSTELQGLEEDIDKIIQALYNDRYIEIDDIRRRRISLDGFSSIFILSVSQFFHNFVSYIS